MSRIDKPIETKSHSGLERWGNKVGCKMVLAKGYGVSSWGNENILNLTAPICEYTKNHSLI